MSLSHKPAHPGSPAPRIIDFFAFCPNMEILNFVMKQGHQWKCCFRFLCSCLPCALDVLPESSRWDSGFFHLGMFPPEVSGEILPSWDMSEARICFHLFPLVAREGDNAVPICLNSFQVQGRTFALKGATSFTIFETWVDLSPSGAVLAAVFKLERKFGHILQKNYIVTIFTKRCFENKTLQ